MQQPGPETQAYINSPEYEKQVNRFKQLTEDEINARVKKYTAPMTPEEHDAFINDPKYFEKLFPERFPNKPAPAPAAAAEPAAAPQGARRRTRRRHHRRKTSRRKQ